MGQRGRPRLLAEMPTDHLDRYARRELSTAELAGLLGVTTDTLYVYLDRWGVEPNHVRKGRPRRARRNANLVAAYHRGTTARQLATMGDGSPGPVTLRLREALVAIQEGKADDPFGWRVKI